MVVDLPKEKEGVVVGVVVEGAGAPNEKEGAVAAAGAPLLDTLVPALKLPPKEKEGAGADWAGATPKEKAGSLGKASSPPGNAKGSETLTLPLCDKNGKVNHLSWCCIKGFLW